MRPLGFVRPPTFTGWVDKQEFLMEIEDSKGIEGKSRDKKFQEERLLHQCEMQQKIP